LQLLQSTGKAGVTVTCLQYGSFQEARHALWLLLGRSMTKREGMPFSLNHLSHRFVSLAKIFSSFVASVTEWLH
jgi:hypothetical protein